MGKELFSLLASVAFLCSCSAPQAPPAPRLKKSIGIITAGDVFSPIIAAGTSLPHTYSNPFGNASDNQTAVEITLAQKDSSGIEKIIVATIDEFPKRPKGKLSVIVTVTVDPQKQLRMKAAVPENGYLKQFPPMPVE
jgi:molecular chaperone DnaK (HSP70)